MGTAPDGMRSALPTGTNIETAMTFLGQGVRKTAADRNLREVACAKSDECSI